MTTHTHDARVPRAPTRSRASIVKVVFASLIGTAVEWYDFFLYGSAAALVFGDAVLPRDRRPDQRDAAGVRHLRRSGFVARPLGGVVFGHFGDRVGRKKMLVVSLLMMGVAHVRDRPAADVRHHRRRRPDPAAGLPPACRASPSAASGAVPS